MPTGFPDQATLTCTPSIDGGATLGVVMPQPNFEKRAAGMQELGILQFNWRALIRVILAPLTSVLLKDRVSDRITEHIKEKYDKESLAALLNEQGVEGVVNVVIEATVLECAQII